MSNPQPSSSIFGLDPTGNPRLPELPHSIPGFRIERFLGTGATGTVVAALDLAAGRTVALKILHQHLADTGVRHRFAREIEHLGSLRHSSLARLHHGGCLDDGRPFYAMDLVDGQPVTTFVRANHCTPDECCRLALKIAGCLAYVHRSGVLHRDVKPGNILVTPDGNPKLLDFGLSLDLDSRKSRQTRPETRLGTFRYMSPEQRSGSMELDERSDLFSLGVVLLEMVTGRLAGDDDDNDNQPTDEFLAPASVRRHLRGLDSSLSSVIGRALAWSPADRYSGLAELGHDLGRYLARQPVAARPVRWPTRLRLFHARHRTVHWILGSTLITLIAGFTLSVTLWREADRSQRLASELRRRSSEACASLLDGHDEPGSSPRSPRLQAALNEFLEQNPSALRSSEKALKKR